MAWRCNIHHVGPIPVTKPCPSCEAAEAARKVREARWRDSWLARFWRWLITPLGPR